MGITTDFSHENLVRLKLIERLLQCDLKEVKWTEFKGNLKLLKTNSSLHSFFLHISSPLTMSLTKEWAIG